MLLLSRLSGRYRHREQIFASEKRWEGNECEIEEKTLRSIQLKVIERRQQSVREPVKRVWCLSSNLKDIF